MHQQKATESMCSSDAQLKSNIFISCLDSLATAVRLRSEKSFQMAKTYFDVYIQLKQDFMSISYSLKHNLTIQVTPNNGQDLQIPFPQLIILESIIFNCLQLQSQGLYSSREQQLKKNQELTQRAIEYIQSRLIQQKLSFYLSIELEQEVKALVKILTLRNELQNFEEKQQPDQQTCKMITKMEQLDQLNVLNLLLVSEFALIDLSTESLKIKNSTKNMTADNEQLQLPQENKLNLKESIKSAKYFHQIDMLIEKAVFFKSSDQLDKAVELFQQIISTILSNETQCKSIVKNLISLTYEKISFFSLERLLLELSQDNILINLSQKSISFLQILQQEIHHLKIKGMAYFQDEESLQKTAYQDLSKRSQASQSSIAKAKNNPKVQRIFLEDSKKQYSDAFETQKDNQNAAQSLNFENKVTLKRKGSFCNSQIKNQNQQNSKENNSVLIQNIESSLLNQSDTRNQIQHSLQINQDYIASKISQTQKQIVLVKKPTQAQNSVHEIMAQKLNETLEATTQTQNISIGKPTQTFNELFETPSQTQNIFIEQTTQTLNETLEATTQTQNVFIEQTTQTIEDLIDVKGLNEKKSNDQIQFSNQRIQFQEEELKIFKNRIYLLERQNLELLQELEKQKMSALEINRQNQTQNPNKRQDRFLFQNYIQVMTNQSRITKQPKVQSTKKGSNKYWNNHLESKCENTIAFYKQNSLSKRSSSNKSKKQRTNSRFTKGFEQFNKEIQAMEIAKLTYKPISIEGAISRKLMFFLNQSSNQFAKQYEGGVQIKK